MKINDIVTESTTAGSIATVAAPMTTQSRNASIYGGKKGGNLLTGKKTNKKYANSVNESKMKELAMDIRNMDNGNFKKKYGNTKEHFKATLGDPAKKTVSEAQLEEDDVIIVPGQGRSRKTGFIKHGESRLDHEVEMARSDLFQAAKNAKQVYEMIADVSEEEGLEGWVQEKIIKANDYLNSVREYLEGKQLQEMTGGVIAGGGVGESAGSTHRFVLPDGIATKYGIDGNAYNKLASMAMAVKQELLRGSHFDQAVSKLNIPVELKDAMREGAMNSIRSKFFIDYVKEYQGERGEVDESLANWNASIQSAPRTSEFKLKAITATSPGAMPKRYTFDSEKEAIQHFGEKNWKHITSGDLNKNGEAWKVVYADDVSEGKGLWDNIHAKRERIKKGSGERMRKPGSKGAPSSQDFKDASK
jgi:hypothetical protein